MTLGLRFRAGVLLLGLAGAAAAQQTAPAMLGEEGTTPQQISILLSQHLRQLLGTDICGYPVSWVVGIDISGSGQTGFQDAVQMVLADLAHWLVVPQDAVRIVPFDREPDPKLDSELVPGGSALARLLPHEGATQLDQQELATLLPRFLETRHNKKGQPVWGSDINKALMFTQREAVALAERHPARRAVVLLFSDRQNNDATDTPYVTVSGLRAPGGGGSLPFTTIPLMLRDVAKPSQFWVFVSVAERNPERGAATNRLMPTGRHLRYPGWLYLVCGLVALVGLCVALPALARARHIVVQWLSEYDNHPARVGDDFDLVVQGGAPDAAAGRRSLEIPMPAVTDSLLQRQMLNQQVGRLEIDAAGGRLVLFERYRVSGGLVGEDSVPRLPRDAGRMEQLRFEFKLEDGGWVPLQYEDLAVAVKSVHAGWRAQLWGGLTAAILALLLALAVRPQWVYDSFCIR